MIPNRLVATALLTRSTRLWVVTRLTLSALFFLAGTDPLRLPIATTFGVLLLCVGVGYIETHLNHERDLLGNLGIKRRNLAAFFLAPALLGELLIRVIASAS